MDDITEPDTTDKPLIQESTEALVELVEAEPVENGANEEDTGEDVDSDVPSDPTDLPTTSPEVGAQADDPPPRRKNAPKTSLIEKFAVSHGFQWDGGKTVTSELTGLGWKKLKGASLVPTLSKWPIHDSLLGG